MKISELKSELEKALLIHGDIPIEARVAFIHEGKQYMSAVRYEITGFERSHTGFTLGIQSDIKEG